MYFAAVLLAIVVHESGHLLAGWSVGFRFKVVSIGPFCLKIEHGRLKVQARAVLVGAAGYAGMHIETVRRLRHRLLIFVSGGPAANLLSAGLSFCLRTYILFPHQQGWVPIFASLFEGISLIFGVMNIVPFSAGALVSDGARIRMLLCSRVRARRWMSITAVTNQSRNGVPAKQVKQTWLCAASSLHDNSIDDFPGNWAAYVGASGRKDNPLAALHLERCLEMISLAVASTQDLVTLEAAVYTAWFRRNPATAQSWLNQVRKFKLIPPVLRIRADVALRGARKEFESALSRSQDGLALIEKLPASPTKTTLREGWMEWQAEIRQREAEESLLSPTNRSGRSPA